MKLSVLITAIIVLFAGGIATAQVGIDTPTPNANSSLDLGATDRGLLLNRITTADRTTLGGLIGAGEKGMIVFDTDLDQIFLWDGGGWKTVDSGGLSGSGNDGELTLWGASNTLTSDADLFWDDTYKRLGIGTQAPSAALSLHSNADIAFDIKNNRGAPISEHIFGIESTNIPVATTDLINLKVPLGSPTDFQFLECEYGTSKVLKINGDGHLNATTIGCGTDDGSARFNIVDPNWDLKMNVVSTGNPSILP